MIKKSFQKFLPIISRHFSKRFWYIAVGCGMLTADILGLDISVLTPIGLILIIEGIDRL